MTIKLNPDYMEKHEQELYAEAVKFSIQKNCDIGTAQLVLWGEIRFKLEG